MALNNIEMIRVITQDNGRLPFLGEGEYILSDEELDSYLSMNNNDVFRSARMAAYAISLWVSGINTREVTGDMEVWNDVSKNYLNALKSFLSDNSLVSVIPKGLMPYAAGVSVKDLLQSAADTDNPNVLNWLYKKPITSCDIGCNNDYNNIKQEWLG